MRMAEILDLDEHCVVGYCHAVWSWVSRHCHGGSVTSVTVGSDACPVCDTGVSFRSLSRVTKTGEFVFALLEVGWLVDLGDGRVGVPNFENWLSQSAKERELAAKRKRQERARKKNSHKPVTEVSRSERDNSHGVDVTYSTVQDSTVMRERRERSDRKPDTSPEGLPSEYREPFNRWCQYRADRLGRLQLDEITRDVIAHHFLSSVQEHDLTPAQAAECVDASIAGECRRNTPWLEPRPSAARTGAHNGCASGLERFLKGST